MPETNTTVRMRDLDKLEEHLNQRFKDADKALEIAFSNMELRLVQRGKEQDEQYLTNKDLKPIRDEINELQKFRDVLDAKASQRAVNWAIAFSLLDLLLSVIWIVSNVAHK